MRWSIRNNKGNLPAVTSFDQGNPHLGFNDQARKSNYDSKSNAGYSVAESIGKNSYSKAKRFAE